MKNIVWIETKKELEKNEEGEWIEKKVTKEIVKPKKEFLGLEIKELADLLVKLSTLIAIIFTALSYFRTLNIIEVQKNVDIDKFLLQKKFESVIDMKKAYALLSEDISETMFERKNCSTETLHSAITECRNIMRQKSIFFTKAERNGFAACVWCYQGLESIPEEKWGGYKHYFSIVDGNFLFLCKSTLGIKSDEHYFEFIGIPEGDDPTVKAPDFLNKNFESWAKSNDK